MGAPPDLADWLTPTRLVDDHQHRPVLFRLADATDRGRFQELRARFGDVQVCDRIRDQIAGLLQTRLPATRLTPDERQEAVDAHLDGTPEYLYGVWAWYPWSRRLVHLLDREEFIELRTDRNHDKITRQERDLLATKRVGIVGLSTGNAVATALAMERDCGELRLADFDSLELSNLNRLRAGVHELGVPKAVLASRAIAEIDPYLSVGCFSDGVRTTNLDEFLLAEGRLDLVFEECDSLDIKLLLRERARDCGIPVAMVTAERGMVDIERFDLEPDRPVMHGIVGGLDTRALAHLSTAEKVPYVIAMMGGAENLPRRWLDSLQQIGRTIETWPQLGSALLLNGAVGADVSRRLLLGGLRASGRYLVDLEALIPDGTG